MPTGKPSFKKVETWPQIEGNAVSPSDQPIKGTLALGGAAWELWAEEAPKNPALQLLGHPAGCEYPIGRDPKHVLLLSLEAKASGLSFDPFGRNGFVFFFLPASALRRRAWDQARHREW